MTALALPLSVPYAERPVAREGGWDRLQAAVSALMHSVSARRTTRRFDAVADAAEAHADRFRALDDAALQAYAGLLRPRLRAAPAWPDPVLAEALAYVREAAHRARGQFAYKVQLVAAAAILRGRAAEMATGEGKTLVAMLAASVAGLGGVPVHLVTVNTYLAERDAAAGRPLYRYLGLTTGLITEKVPPHERRAAYRCDVVVCTSKDLAFDYMRDRVAAGRRIGTLRLKAARVSGAAIGATPLLRGLHFAIIDEADSVLVDEARTPLILAAPGDDGAEIAVVDTALAIARSLRPGTDYTVLHDERQVMVTRAGRTAAAAAVPDGAPWDEPAERERLVDLAMTALHTLNRGEHYVIQAGKAELVDEFTGRIMADRSWSDGLQGMVERKEGIALSDRHLTLARMTYQRFFRRYRRLAGLSGTLREVAGELWRVYRLPVACVGRHRPDQRRMAAPVAVDCSSSKWDAIASCTAEIHDRGAPVLIGTRTVAASEHASAALTARGLDHTLLSAVQSAREADIIAAAGAHGAITVATNMAGRGTDIRLDDTARAAGGLHVIISEQHEARRIDRQLAGRCGRQGDPGAVLPFCAPDDTLIARHGPSVRVWAGKHWRHRLTAAPALCASAQRRAERLHARMRRDLLRSDEWLGDAVAFAGDEE